MQRVSVIVLFLVFLSACKKDKLEGDTAILIGKWKWKSSEVFAFGGYGQAIYNEQTDGVSRSIEFTHTGRMYTYENSKKKDCYRIVFNSIKSQSDNTYFEIYPNNKKKKLFSVTLLHRTNIDSIVVSHFFPYSNTDENDWDTYYNYFTREN